MAKPWDSGIITLCSANPGLDAADCHGRVTTKVIRRSGECAVRYSCWHYGWCHYCTIQLWSACVICDLAATIFQRLSFGLHAACIDSLFTDWWFQVRFVITVRLLQDRPAQSSFDALFASKDSLLRWWSLATLSHPFWVFWMRQRFFKIEHWCWSCLVCWCWCPWAPCLEPRHGSWGWTIHPPGSWARQTLQHIFQHRFGRILRCIPQIVKIWVIY